jgi:LacI family transcriptional regulator
MSPATMRDVARHAGLSLYTVSKVLNGNGGVTAATRNKVLESCEALGYARNPYAVNLVKGKSKTIGLLVSQILNPFYGEMVEAAERMARQLGYDLIYRCSYLDVDQESEIVRQFMALRVCGLIITPIVSQEAVAKNQEFLRSVAQKVPLIYLDRFLDIHSNYIINDNFSSGRTATEHLIQLGRAPHYLSTRRSVMNSALQAREAGYHAAMQAAGLAPRFIDGQGAPSPRDDEKFGFRAVQTHLSEFPAPEAIFCANDLVAIGALGALSENGLKVGTDVLLVGHDDISVAAYLNPPLTTMAAPKLEMGRHAIEAIVRLNSDPTLKIQEVLTSELKVRPSTLAPLAITH